MTTYNLYLFNHTIPCGTFSTMQQAVDAAIENDVPAVVKYGDIVFYSYHPIYGERYTEEYRKHVPVVLSGCLLIEIERQRQVSEEGFTLERDDQYTDEQLAEAALFYAAPEKYGEMLAFWPWDKSWNKKSKHNRIKQLAIAGALIAAEIDRLQRQVTK